MRRYEREEMLPHAQALYEACLVAGFPESPDQNHPDSTGIGPTPSNNQEGVRMSTALAYLDQARHRPNLTIRANVTARRLLFAGKRAVGVEAESGRERFTVEGEQIVLSAGYIASPHLLLLSGVGPGGAVAEPRHRGSADLPGVGQNLRDHPYVPILFREMGKAPDFRQAAVQVLLRYTAEGSTMRNDMQIGHISLVSAYLPANVPLRKDENCFFMYANIQRAASVGELTLTSTDPHVQPAINYRYLSDPWDRERMCKAIRLAVQLSEHPAFKDIILERVSLTEAGIRIISG